MSYRFTSRNNQNGATLSSARTVSSRAVSNITDPHQIRRPRSNAIDDQCAASSLSVSGRSATLNSRYSTASTSRQSAAGRLVVTATGTCVDRLYKPVGKHSTNQLSNSTAKTRKNKVSGDRTIKLTRPRTDERYIIPFYSVESTLTKIKRRFQDSLENGITDDQVELSLICPISCKRNVSPVRFKDCKHLETFHFWNLIDVEKQSGYDPNEKSARYQGDRQGLGPLSRRLSNGLTQLDTNVRHLSSSTQRMMTTYRVDNGYGNQKRIYNFMRCPICNLMCQSLKDIVFCEYTKEALKTTAQDIDKIFISADGSYTDNKPSTQLVDQPTIVSTKYLETDSGSLYTVDETTNGSIPTLHIESCKKPAARSLLKEVLTAEARSATRRLLASKRSIFNNNIFAKDQTDSSDNYESSDEWDFVVSSSDDETGD